MKKIDEGKLSGANLIKILKGVPTQPVGMGKPSNKKMEPDPKKPGVPKVDSMLVPKKDNDLLHVIKTPRKTTVIVSPFMAEDRAMATKMARYGERCVRDSLKRNEAPIAQHLFFFGLDGVNNMIERDIGLQCQLSWVKDCDMVAIYVDFEITAAMRVVFNLAQAKNKRIEFRQIGAHA